MKKDDELPQPITNEDRIRIRFLEEERKNRRLMILLTVVAGISVAAFTNWATSVRETGTQVLDLLADARVEIRAELADQRKEIRELDSKFDKHLDYSVLRVQDYEARLRLIEDAQHRHENRYIIEGKRDKSK